MDSRRSVFSSSARLAALARFVADTQTDETIKPEPTQTVRKMPQLPSYAERQDLASNYYHASERGHIQIQQQVQPVQPVVQSQPQSVYNNVPATSEKVVQQTSGLDDNTFYVTSAGFEHGNYAEIKLGSKTFLPRALSRRGISVVCLNQSTGSFKAWNFDFYPNPTKNSTNRNFVGRLVTLPGHSYFAIAVRDDAKHNMFEGTIRFLDRVVGSKTIRRLEYRDSWCIVVYKPTKNTFKVLSESHNPNGMASINVPLTISDTSSAIYTEDPNIKHPQQTQQPQQFQPSSNPQFQSQSLLQQQPQHIAERQMPPPVSQQSQKYNQTDTYSSLRPNRERSYQQPVQQVGMDEPGLPASVEHSMGTKSRWSPPDEPREPPRRERVRSFSQSERKLPNPLSLSRRGRITVPSAYVHKPVTTHISHDTDNTSNESDSDEREEEIKHERKTRELKKDINSNKEMLKNLGKESKKLKEQIEKQTETIRSLRLMITDNDSVLQQVFKLIKQAKEKAEN
jgi:hypothetical protein